MDTVHIEALIQDLAFHRLEDKLLSHVLHTRPTVSCWFRESRSFRVTFIDFGFNINAKLVLGGILC